ncbi:hypothetical protein ACJBPZ_07970 [Streptococcus suis]|nr:hypothetical protein [Streptococcus suis]QBX21189.1 hypothetical protein Javan565_0014 [Streptococcus phage Javan565]MCB2949634.1 hypothetical protein [Streptococcus suis]MCH1657352.1 hypothetical protein [Streptococcus suis]MCH1662774.1 hypothetical protein [Streptococcus suis]MCK3949349.1 hypothetical protein [Streptococcus suis]
MVASQSGFSLSDVLEADFETLLSILSAKTEEKEEVMSMEMFMNQCSIK